jgi:hypothetical protein
MRRSCVGLLLAVALSTTACVQKIILSSHQDPADAGVPGDGGLLDARGDRWLPPPPDGYVPPPDGGAPAADGAPHPADGPRPADGAPAPQSDASPNGPQPGDGVQWLDYPALNSTTGSGWGPLLTDIAQHIPQNQLSTYWDSDPITAAHETSHGIHAYLRNYYNNTGSAANGFYVLGSKAAIVKEPNMRKSDVAGYIPSELRGMRFSLYITGQTEWDDTPLYVWDEWNAYLNGTAVGVDLATAGNWTSGWQDGCMGTLEFVIYGLAVGMAARDHDAAYFSSYRQFTEFMAWNLRRSMQTYAACAVLPEFAWDEQDQLLAKLRTGAAGDAMRQFARTTFGAAWTQQVLGF